MIISVSSSAAVRNMTGTFDVCRILWQKSKPEPSGSETSKITRSYFPSAHKEFASRMVRAITISYPCFFTAKESPFIRLKSSSSKNNLFTCHTLPFFFFLQKCNQKIGRFSFPNSLDVRHFYVKTLKHPLIIFYNNMHFIIVETVFYIDRVVFIILIEYIFAIEFFCQWRFPNHH